MSSRALSLALRRPYLLLALGLALVAALVVAVTTGPRPAGALGRQVAADNAGVEWMTPPGGTCSAVNVPVSLFSGGSKGYTIAGEMCRPSGVMPSTLQVLVPGATYDRYYWNPPDQPQKYSYVWAATKAGYATLTIDPLGTGLSSKPFSALVTVPSSAYTVHQVIQAARAGSLGVTAFKRVILSGHSMGVALAWNEIANYQDVDGLIAADNTHIPSVLGAVTSVLTLYPSMLDPKFAGANLDPGYLTTRPGTREGSFYHDGDPSRIADDELLKQSVTATFLATYFVEDVNLDASRIHVPVLVVAGQHDALMCAPLLGTNCDTSSNLLAAEAPFYSDPASCLQSYVLPGSGHDVNLTANAQQFFSVANRWADRWVGSTGKKVAAHACTGPVGPAS
jgi:pimeloyl-ACP methyl ester carboxylesterase